MDQFKFDVVFEKLDEARRADETDAPAAALQVLEYDEIEEVRRFAAELMQPEPATFTST